MKVKDWHCCRFAVTSTAWVVATLLMVTLILAWPSQAQEGGQDYTIQSSDSLWKLAEKYLGDGNLYPSIIQATADKAATDPSLTPISSPDLIFPGQKICLL